jgi:hypothetical protein
LEPAVLEFFTKALKDAGYEVIKKSRIKRLCTQSTISHTLLEALKDQFNAKRVADQQMVKTLADELMKAPFVVRRTSEQNQHIPAIVWRAEVTVIEDEHGN